MRIQTAPQVALIYRLLGGRSLIHFDPEEARAQGFDGPIMHGLSTYGHACHAVLQGACEYDVARLRAFGAEFSAPAYPGDNLETSLWIDGGAIAFETRVPERDALVLANGHARLRPG